MIDPAKIRLFHFTLPFVTMTMTGLCTRVRQTEAWPIDAFVVFPYWIAALIIALGFVVYAIEQLPELFGYPISMRKAPGKAEIVPDMQTMADMLCDPSSKKIVAAYIILYSIFSVNPADPHSLNCDLETIDLSDRVYLKNNLPRFYEVNVNVPYPAVFYLNRKRFNRSTIDRFNQIVQAMFDLEKQDSLWWRRFTGRRRETFSSRAPKSEFAYSPLPLSALLVILYVCAAIIIAAILCFVVELTPLYSKVYRCLHRFVRVFN
ncbi:hypothetical protein PENTCL1PPCAC_17089 [Pristionchus entomophagus]|uniref:Uncharacterized protein n=1 Tax=Pristionchus entomophagus TaxID=358040 RepID=A0AAV5TLF5_9BILA|nr:hypothetical protein PENTCL1PPCAC_17089 [Pristionchus entomophagus]